MTDENIVKENLQMVTISPNNLKDRLETLVHVIALVHAKLPNICLQTSTKRKQPKKVAVTPHQKKTFCSPRLGRCPHCRKRTNVSKLTEKQNRFKCKHKKCGKATAMKKWLCVKCSRTRKLISKSIVVIAMRRHSWRRAVPIWRVQKQQQQQWQQKQQQQQQQQQQKQKHYPVWPYKVLYGLTKLYGRIKIPA